MGRVWGYFGKYLQHSLPKNILFRKITSLFLKSWTLWVICVWNETKQTICLCGKFLNFPALWYDGSNPPEGSLIFGGLERTLVFTFDRFLMPMWRVGCEVFWLQKCHLLPALCKTNCQTFSGHSCLPNSPLSKIYSTSMPSPFRAKAREQYLMRQCLNSSRMSVSESYVGKYTKQKLLGKGTFGEAWLVVSTVSGRWCLLV